MPCLAQHPPFEIIKIWLAVAKKIHCIETNHNQPLWFSRGNYLFQAGPAELFDEDPSISTYILLVNGVHV